MVGDEEAVRDGAQPECGAEENGLSREPGARDREHVYEPASVDEQADADAVRVQLLFLKIDYWDNEEARVRLDQQLPQGGRPGSGGGRGSILHGGGASSGSERPSARPDAWWR